MINTVEEPKEFQDNRYSEHCCFCGTGTRKWYRPKDVPVCDPCAEVFDPKDVPSKEFWCNSPQAEGKDPKNIRIKRAFMTTK